MNLSRWFRVQNFGKNFDCNEKQIYSDFAGLKKNIGPLHAFTSLQNFQTSLIHDEWYHRFWRFKDEWMHNFEGYDFIFSLKIKSLNCQMKVWRNFYTR